MPHSDALGELGLAMNQEYINAVEELKAALLDERDAKQLLESARRRVTYWRKLVNQLYQKSLEDVSG